MVLFEPIYTKVLHWARHPHGERYLAGISFAESSFFPVPVDVMLAPMVLADRPKAWRLAAITTVMSVLGGMFGYLIGAYFFDSYGTQLLNYFDAHETFSQVQASYIKHGMLIVLLAGFTPIPYKVFTIASGVIGIAIVPFMLMSLLGRGGRFFLVAALVKLGGDRLEETILAKIELIGWATLLLAAVLFTLYKFW
ncbi:MAG: DedA family protein [Gammaproteobacteria bacterium]|nr:DedA family protein [Gammaproteobacteria bacterium]